MSPTSPPNARIRVEPTSWTWLKHVVQLALAGAVLFFVMRGGDMPVATLAWIGAAFIGIVGIALADRQRFFERTQLEYHPVLEVANLIVADAAPQTVHVDPPQHFPTGVLFEARVT
ncbi:MAG: hypothetical protein JWN41_577 [Thermoleophilia bacterium]|nr:hypothetical protein [Thermoleophilia bacterium]